MAAGRKTGGREKGTPNKATADIKAIAQLHSEAAVSELVRIMGNSESDAARVAAIKELLDRAHGKPKQAMDIDANVEATTYVIKTGVPRAHRGD